MLTVCAFDVLATLTAPKFSDVGVTVICCIDVPVRLTVCGFPTALSEKDRVAFSAVPAGEVGLNLTVTEQLEFFARVPGLGHVFDAIAKSALPLIVGALVN